ncbi:cupin domain-containing protein [Prevotella koreensis]|uniref:cupin domain-containing protein n=1 Tax=Prevotella koreensis TaxID=2490854 RepID=UPI0028E46AD9|nr:cupin domain-containing protein [Prevotella koreensis]
MKINKEQLEEKILPKFKEGEGQYIMRAYDDDDNKLMFGTLEPGCSIGYHTHTNNSETMYILSGVATYVIDGGVEEVVLPNEVHYCPKGRSHSLQNRGTENLTFFAVIGQHNE